MTDVQYNNIQIFAEQWRKYQPTGPSLAKEVFLKTIQMERYVRMDFVDQKNNRAVAIFLIARGHNISNAQSIRQLLNKFNSPMDIILITEEALNNFGIKALRSYKHLHVERLLHENFSLVVPHGPLCYPHRILSRDEINTLLNEELYCRLINLPKILQSDVQCVWLGARIGDVIEIEMANDVNGRALHYRVVVQKSGRMAQQAVQPPAEPTDDQADQDDGDDQDNQEDGADQDESEPEPDAEPEADA